MIWEKDKIHWDKVSLSNIDITIPNIKSNEKILFHSVIHFNNTIYVNSIVKSMTFSIFEWIPRMVAHKKLHWKTYWYRSRPALGFTIFTIILVWLFRRRELEAVKIEQELEQERKNKEILETTFGVTEQNDDIKLFEAVMSNDITKLQKIKSIHPTINILKFNAMIEHTEEEKLERLKILVEKGIDLKFKDDNWMTALMYYALGNINNDKKSKIIEFLLQKGLDINAQNDSGMTALMLCAMKNRPASVQMLIDNGADINIKQDLTAKELAATKEIRDMIEEVENHSPRQLVSLLEYFRKPTPIKFTTHGWDGIDLKKDYGSFQGFLSNVKEQWDEIKLEMQELSPHLHNKIENFLFADIDNIKNWSSKEGDELAIGWSSIDGLQEWCNNENDPFNFKLSKTYNVNGKDIQLFCDVITLFKQEIQVRRENDILENILKKKERELYRTNKFKIEKINLKGKQFYTDTEILYNVLDRIFKQFQDNNEFKKITVEVIEDRKGKYHDLKITQHNSFSNKNALQLLKDTSGGDFAFIKKYLLNLCDWSVESRYNDECFRVNILKSSNIEDIESLIYEAQGFTHIMRFYL